MSTRKFLISILAFVALVAGGEMLAQPAQAPATETAVSDVPEGGVPRYIKPETPEQRAERLGTPEDPGPDPDPEKIYWRFGKQYKIEKVEKEFAKYSARPGWVRPLAQMNFEKEIYQENDKFIWVWHLIREKRNETPAADRKFNEKAIEYFKELRAEFTPIDVPQSGRTMKFENASTGLPTSGSWRNGAAVADMNGDGRADLILPPQRGAADVPSIFLNDGNGGWKLWEVRWPREFNYGSVVAADFNKDKNVDLAFSVHLTGVAVFLGDGKGGFREVSKGLDRNFPTRRLVAADIDADGWMDFAAISEGPVGRGTTSEDKVRGHIRGYVNRSRGEAWEAFDIAEPREYTGGDFLTAANLNGDKFPDFVSASVYFNTAHTLFVSGGARDYASAAITAGPMLVPGRSYYQATAAGRFRRNAKTDDAIVTYTRNWPASLSSKLVPTPPLAKVTGLDRIAWVDGKPTRTPIVRWEAARKINGVAAADFDGDGNLDVAYVDAGVGEVKFLSGDGAGSFKRAAAEGIKLAPQTTYDLLADDLNGDGRPDLLLMYESDETTVFQAKNGSVQLFLNRGASR